MVKCEILLIVGRSWVELRSARTSAGANGKLNLLKLTGNALGAQINEKSGFV